ncbi:MAG: hypothetical protein QM532_00670 [Cyanobium sp. MAG06]|nr:hypothetical protein [Cyanobium sp. MAG06]
MNHDNGGIRYNDGGVFQTDSSCKIFVPKAEIEQVSGVLNDINFNCEQSNRYKLYFVENKRISEMNSGD